jgi:hypothetical protein
MKISLNDTEFSMGSIEDLGEFLDRLDREVKFEFWISTENGPSMAMLRNGDCGWLMYLHFNGDRGLVTKGDQSRQGNCAYELSNGQVDEYPLSWCIDLEQCYKAIAYFFVNEGARYEFVTWQVA